MCAVQYKRYVVPTQCSGYMYFLALQLSRILQQKFGYSNTFNLKIFSFLSL